MVRSKRLRSLADTLVFGLFGKAVGFFIPIAVAASFGISRGTDGFFLAFAVGSALVAVWSQALEQFCVPLLAEVEGRATVAARKRWIYRRTLPASAATWIIAGLGLALYLVLAVPPALRTTALVAYGLLAPQVVCAAAGAVASAYLISRGGFRWSAGSTVLRAIGVLLLVWLAPRALGLAALSLGYSVGELLRTSVLWLAGRRFSKREGAEVGSAVPRAGTTGRGVHQLGAMALLGVAPVTERSVAATLAVGAVSRLEYATKLFYVPSAIFDTNLVSVFLSDWSRLVARHEYRELHRDARRMVTLILVLATTMSGGIVAFREPLVRLALRHGSFPAGEAPVIASLLAVLIVAFPFASAGMLAGGAFVALGENRFLFRVSLLKMVLRSIASIALSRWLGVYGIAIAFVATHIVELIVLLAHLGPTLRRFDRGHAVPAPALVSAAPEPTAIAL